MSWERFLGATMLPRWLDQVNTLWLPLHLLARTITLSSAKLPHWIDIDDAVVPISIKPSGRYVEEWTRQACCQYGTGNSRRQRGDQRNHRAFEAFQNRGTCGGGKQVSKVAKIIQEIHHMDQTPKGTEKGLRKIEFNFDSGKGKGEEEVKGMGSTVTKLVRELEEHGSLQVGPPFKLDIPMTIATVGELKLCTLGPKLTGLESAIAISKRKEKEESFGQKIVTPLCGPSAMEVEVSKVH